MWARPRLTPTTPATAHCAPDRRHLQKWPWAPWGRAADPFSLSPNHGPLGCSISRSAGPRPPGGNHGRSEAGSRWHPPPLRNAWVPGRCPRWRTQPGAQERALRTRSLGGTLLTNTESPPTQSWELGQAEPRRGRRKVPDLKPMVSVTPTQHCHPRHSSDPTSVC